MRVIKESVTEIIEQDILKRIEYCGRICYKSEEQISEGSALRFVKMLVDRKHWAMLEHAPLVLEVTLEIAKAILNIGHGTFLNVTINEEEDRYLISGNIRAWLTLFTDEELLSRCPDRIIGFLECRIQASLGDVYSIIFPHMHDVYNPRNFILLQNEVLSLENLTDEEAKAHLYLTAHFICDRGVSHELVRHRPASFAQESTRYCNYGKKSFGEEITFIDPGFEGETLHIWADTMLVCERAYFDLLDKGLTPQYARGVLPTDVKTEVVMTCNLKEWQHVINLRYHGTTGAPHPHMFNVMKLWYELIRNKKWYDKWID